MRNFVPTNVARIIFALTMCFFGLGHLTSAAQMSGMIAGWPMATFLIYASGACLILAGVSFIINKYVKLAGYLLALLLIIIVVGVHLPGMGNQDKMMAMMSTSMAVKDAAIAMGAIVIANEAQS
jgi:putative oxidoreductase